MTEKHIQQNYKITFLDRINLLNSFKHHPIKSDMIWKVISSLFKTACRIHGVIMSHNITNLALTQYEILWSDHIALGYCVLWPICSIIKMYYFSTLLPLQPGLAYPFQQFANYVAPSEWMFRVDRTWDTICNSSIYVQIDFDCATVFATDRHCRIDLCVPGPSRRM